MLRRRITRPIIGSRFIICIGEETKNKSEEWGRIFSVITFIRSIIRFRKYDSSLGIYQIGEVYGDIRGRQDNVKRSRGVDGISRLFVRLTTIRVPLCRRGSKKGVKKNKREYYARFLIRETFVRGAFIVTDRLWFYIRFEGVIIPIYMRVGIWGSRERKVRAGYFFRRYTLAGSLIILISILYLSNRYGTTDMVNLKIRINSKEGGLERGVGQMRWVGFFVGLAVKVPIVPVHIWLPEAHVEAPTGGSVILAGVLLKLGGYGIVRIRRGRLPSASVYFQPRVYTIGVIGMVYAGMTARRQTDIKRIVAYASVSHINMTVVGRFTITEEGREGGILQMLSHGIVASGRFRLIGVIYDRYHTRRVVEYGGRIHTIPRYGRVFLRFTLGNMGIPGISSFVGEVRLRIGIVKVNNVVRRISVVSIILGAGYSLWVYNRVIYGNIKRLIRSENKGDLEVNEIRIFIPLIGFLFRLGLCPGIVLDIIRIPCLVILESLKINS